MLFGSLLLWAWCRRDGSISRADAAGLDGPSLGHLRRKFVRNGLAVETCEIHTFVRHPRPPQLPSSRFSRIGAVGELMIPDLSHTRLEDQERLATYIRAKLPKSQEEFLEGR